MDYKKFIIKQFLKSVSAVNPAKLIADNFKIEEGKLRVCDKVYLRNLENFYLIGFGKAVLGMASQCEKILGNRLKRGVICVPENIQVTFKNTEFSLKPDSVIEVHEGARNNLPDENAEKGADAIVQLVKSLDKEKDNLIVLISGGGSALFPKPKPGITLAEKLQTIILLTSSGADIYELNTVRKKLSQVKGGGLACLSYPITTICLILSDVINDPLDFIASGPTTPNLDSDTAAWDLLKKYNLLSKVSENIINAIKGVSPKNNIPIVKNSYAHVDNFIIGNNLKALKACKEYAENQGFESVILSTKVEGSVESVSHLYINLITKVLKYFQNQNLDLFKENLHNLKTDEIFQALKKSNKTICLLAGGEITLKVHGKGKGGRSQELALVMSMKLYELKLKNPELFNKYNVIFLASGTDGIDGPTDAAGAVAEFRVVERANKINLNVNEYLRNNDSYNFFQNIGENYLIKIGHTGTNVMDIHSILIYPN